MLIPWITTRSFVIDLVPSWNKTQGEKDWSLGRVTIDIGRVHEELHMLIAELNADQWEIKHITPLEKGVTYHEQQKVMQSSRARMSESVLGAFGLGWGTQITSGFVVIAQRTIYISQEEYKEKRETLKPIATASLEETRNRAEMKAISRQLNDLRGAQAIQVKKLGLLRGEKYIFDSIEYSSLIEAENTQMNRINELEAKLAKLSTDVR